jgi:hypothetical protein
MPIGRRRRGADLERVAAAGGEGQVSVDVDGSSAHCRRIGAQLGGELGDRRYFRGAGPEHELKGIQPHLHGQRLALRDALGQQVRRCVCDLAQAQSGGEEVVRGGVDREVDVRAGRIQPQLVGAAAGVERRVDRGRQSGQPVDVRDNVVESVAGGKREVVGSGDATGRGDHDPERAGVGAERGDARVGEGAGAGHRRYDVGELRDGTRDLCGDRSAGNRIGRERRRIEQLGFRDVDVAIRRPRIAREVGAVFDLRRRLRRQEIVLELQDLRHAADQVSGRRIDRDAHQEIACPVDQEAVLVGLEVAAAGITLDAAEHRLVVDDGRRLFDREEAVAVDRHEGADRGGLDVALHRVGHARIGDHAAGQLLGRPLVGDQVDEAGVDALEGGGLRIGDVAGDVFERE